MSALKHFEKEIRNELPKADEWLITYSAKVRLRSWIERNFKTAELRSALKHFMNEDDQRVAFTEGKASLFPIDEEEGYSSPYKEMVETDTASFYEAVKTTFGAVADRVQEAMIVVCFGGQITATI
jgi:hypothetical protein